MKNTASVIIGTTVLFAACGFREQESSRVLSSEYSGIVWGATVLSISDGDLRLFLDGQDVPALKGVVLKREEIRSKLDAKHRINPALAGWAVRSPTGVAITQALTKFIIDDSVETDGPKVLRQEAEKGEFTVYQLMHAYPANTMRINLVSFWSLQNTLEDNLAKLEKQFPPNTN